jgi:hypothetical protein
LGRFGLLEVHVTAGWAANNRTRIHASGAALSLPLDGPDAFAAAYPRLREAAGHAPPRSVLATAVDEAGRVLGISVMASGSALTIGRHDHAGLVLPSSHVSLRQAVLHVTWPSTELCPVVRMWDLATGHPFHTEDGLPTLSAMAEGPLLLTLERYVVLVLPAAGPWPEDAGEAWRALPPRTFLDRRSITEERRSRGEHISVITRVGAPVSLGPGGARAGACAEVHLSAGPHTERGFVTADHLSRGLLVGRYSRCALGARADESLSRVHLLLVRAGGAIWAIDTGSTNGTEHQGRSVAAASLGDDDEVLMAGTVSLRVRRLEVPST